MGCNCKGKTPNVVLDELAYLELIKIGVVDGGKLSTNQKNMLYDYYNQQFKPDVNVGYNCGNCWDGFIKEKLDELWKRKSLENQQS